MSIACVKISHLPLRCEIARRSDLDAQIIIVYHGEESRPVVLDASPNARLRRGESLVRAMSQHPEAAVIRADEAFYDARWHEIIESLLNVSDRVEDAVRGAAFVAIDGLSELHGGQVQTIELISEAASKLGLDAQIGVAPGRFPAYCAAIKAHRHDIGARAIEPEAGLGRAGVHDHGRLAAAQAEGGMSVPGDVHTHSLRSR